MISQNLGLFVWARRGSNALSPAWCLAIITALVGVTHAASLRLAPFDQLRSENTHAADALDSFTWVGRYQVLSRAESGSISGIKGRIEVGAAPGEDPMWIRVWHDNDPKPIEVPINPTQLDSEGWATIVVRWDRTRQGVRQEFRVNGAVVASANIDASTASHPLGAPVILGGSDIDSRQYDIGLFDRWLSDDDVRRYESFLLNVAEMPQGRSWAIMGGFGRQDGRVLPGDEGIQDLAQTVEFQLYGSPGWDNEFATNEFVFDVKRREQPFVSSFPGPAEPSATVRFMNWNIEYWPGGTGGRPSPSGSGFNPVPENVQMQLDAVVGVLEEHRPDILCLQEVYNLEALEYLRNNLSLEYSTAICTAYGYDNSGSEIKNYQNLHVNPGDWRGIVRPPYRFESGILTRYPVEDTWELDMYEQIQADPGNPVASRGVLGARIAPPGRDPITVYIVHPRHTPEMAANRLDVIRVVLRDIEACGLDPRRDGIIICGDMNVSLYSPEPEPQFDLLKAAGFVESWEGVERSKRATLYVEPTKPRTLDYIFISESYEPRRAKVVPNSGSPDKANLRAGISPGIASDHYALQVELFPPEQTFAVIGDYGSGNTLEGIVASMVQRWDPEYIVTTGDNNYGDLLTQWGARVGSYYGPYVLWDEVAGASRHFFQTSTVQRFFPALGNHDTPTFAGTAEHYLDYFHDNASGAPGRLPVGTGKHENFATYYDFVKGDVHFWIIDSEHARTNTQLMDEQKAWLQNGLADSDSVWNIVVAHHSAYSSGRHGSDPLMQWPYEQWGADAFIGGHDHIYERVHQGTDFPYFVNGAGGAAMYEFGQIAVGSTVRYNYLQGAMKVTAGKGRLRFEFHSIENGGMLVDEYELDACYPDCDESTGSGVLDIFDFLCFQSGFVANQSFACDCDMTTGEGVCDIFDFLCFQTAFVVGCE